MLLFTCHTSFLMRVSESHSKMNNFVFNDLHTHRFRILVQICPYTY